MLRTPIVPLAVISMSIVIPDLGAAPAVRSPRGAQEKTCLIVAPFRNTSGWHDDSIGFAAATELADQLHATRDFAIIGPGEVQSVLDDESKEVLDPFDSDLIGQVAERLRCPYVVAGRVAGFSVKSYSGGIRLVRGSMTRASSKLNVYLIDAPKGEMVLKAEGDGSKTSGGASVRDVEAEIADNLEVAREMLRPAVSEFAPELTRRARSLPRQQLEIGGSIVGGGADGAVYIDRGANFDLQIGQRFVVSRVLDEIRNAAGDLLDQIVDQVGVVEVTRVMTRSAICRVVEGEAVEGDTVRLQPGQ